MGAHCIRLYLALALVFLACSVVIGAPTSNGKSVNRGHKLDAEFRRYDNATIKIGVKGPSGTVTTAAPSGNDNLSVQIQAFGQLFSMDLQPTRYLIHPKYVERSVTPSGQITHYDNATTTSKCYYSGKVTGKKHSIVAADTCNGFSARILTDGEIYHIEPIDDSLDGQHRAYKQSDTLLPQAECGHSHTSSISYTSTIYKVNRRKRDIAWPQELLGTTRIVELYVVNDYTQYVSQGSSVSAVAARTKQIVNLVSAMYQTQDIYVSLVGMEVWTNGSLITVNASDVSGTLSRFANYRTTNINPFIKNDNAHFISTVQYTGGVVGLGYVPGMCSSTSVSVVSDFSTAVGMVSSTMAHEMGHNFGLMHDNSYSTDCNCSDTTGQCIMSQYLNSPPGTTWSQCSVSGLSSFLSAGSGNCLNDFNGVLFDPTPVCGNGFVEAGEQCDCGNAPVTECNPACCNSTTCQLLSPSTCAAGKCCNVATCQLKPITTLCRSASGPCDLAEYCSGVSNTCPSDYYVHDGTSCTVSGVAAYCAAGKCRTHNTQCQLWWGPTVNNTGTDCYQYINTAGTNTGNCGYNATTGVYKACNTSDIKCGTLHCNINVTNITSQLKLPSTPQTNVYGVNLVYGSGAISLCTAGSYKDSQPPYTDQGYVPDGASCGTGQMCLNQRCVATSGVLSQTPCPNCNNHGTCNNLGQCHCDVGYAPPDCSQPGNGGSYSSNPISILTTTSLQP